MTTNAKIIMWAGVVVMFIGLLVDSPISIVFGAVVATRMLP